MLQRSTSTMAALIVAVAMGTAAAGEVDLPHYSGDQFADMFRSAPRDVALPTDPPPPITGDTDLDARIRSMAEAKGYVRQPVADGNLERVDDHLVHPEVAAAWRGLQAAARTAGYSIVVVSGYRSLDDQRATFLSGLSDQSEAALDYRLSWSAPPGYSKHHTGYAIDVALAGSNHNQFGGTAAHDWMAADNYHNAKRFGFIPSYPDDGPPQGPNPEPWEWLYVGVETIICSSDVSPTQPACRVLAFTTRRAHQPVGVWPH